MVAELVRGPLLRLRVDARYKRAPETPNGGRVLEGTKLQTFDCTSLARSYFRLCAGLFSLHQDRRYPACAAVTTRNLVRRFARNVVLLSALE